jgi:hypothetical protein
VARPRCGCPLTPHPPCPLRATHSRRRAPAHATNLTCERDLRRSARPECTTPTHRHHECGGRDLCHAMRREGVGGQGAHLFEGGGQGGWQGRAAEVALCHDALRADCCGSPVEPEAMLSRRLNKALLCARSPPGTHSTKLTLLTLSLGVAPAVCRAKEKGEKRSAVRDVKTMEATIHMHKRLHGKVYVLHRHAAPSPTAHLHVFLSSRVHLRGVLCLPCLCLPTVNRCAVRLKQHTLIHERLISFTGDSRSGHPGRSRRSRSLRQR